MSLEIKNICFSYDKKLTILDDVSMSVSQGERVGIAGESGRGKTTFCSIIAGYRRPDSGQVLLDGVSIYDRKGRNPIQMIWQHPEYSVDPRLRMRETMKEAGDIDKRIYDSLGIEDNWFSRFPSELSGGEIQRFCIARALGQETKYIIADEISTMLDVITQAQIWNFLLAEIKTRNIGLIAVTHSNSLMDFVAERTVTL